jgi:hypothetical protein
MRSGTAIVLALVGLWLAPGAAGAHPAVVAGTPVAAAQLRERARGSSEPSLVRDALGELVLARWVAGESPRRGARADPDEVAAAIRRQRASDQHVDKVDRAQMAETVLRRALVDAITAQTRGSRAWGAAFDDLSRRWRAKTTCARGASAPRGRCANLPLGPEHCRWIAFGDLCHVPSEWFIELDLIGELHSPGADLNCVPEGDDAVARVRAYLARTAPAVRKRLFFDSDCDPQLITARHRADLVVALHAVARLRAG